jgi:arsenite methyltransferase
LALDKKIDMVGPESNSSSIATSTGHAMSSASWIDAHYVACQCEYEAMISSVGLKSGWHVLDAGCGSGGFLPIMAELIGPNGKISAIDVAPEHVDAVRRRADANQYGLLR